MRAVSLSVAALLAASAVSLAGPAQAQDGADFFRGKTITIYTGVGLGSSYGTNAHLFAQTFKTKLPGQPNVIAVAMAGAGGAKMVNYLYNVAPKDGLAIGFPLKYLAVNQALGVTGLRYDAAKFNYLGSIGSINSVVAVWASTTPAKTVQDAMTREVIMGSSGRSSETFITPTLMNNLLGTKFKVITGYEGTAPIHVAMERGEVHGVAASWDSVKGEKQAWLREKKVVLLAQSGAQRNWDLQNLPTLLDLARTPEQKEILTFFANGNAVGSLMMLPPDVPAARVATMRKAFDDTMNDQAYVTSVKQKGFDIEPVTGDRIAALVRDTLSVPPQTMEKIKAAMGMNTK